MVEDDSQKPATQVIFQTLSDSSGIPKTKSQNTVLGKRKSWEESLHCLGDREQDYLSVRWKQKLDYHGAQGAGLAMLLSWLHKAVFQFCEGN